MQRQTYMPKKADQDRRWVLVDLDGAILGRAATRIANILRGKHKPTFAPYLDMGDFVVAINAEKVQLTGKKLTDKVYYKHSGYRGGLKKETAGDILKKKPEELIRHAVSSMLPKNKSRKHMLKKLKVYTGTKHPHEAQRPEPISLDDKEVIEESVAAKTREKPVKKVTPKKKVVAKPQEEKIEKKPQEVVETKGEQEETPKEPEASKEEPKEKEPADS